MEEKEFKFEEETNENNVSTETEPKGGEEVEVKTDNSIVDQETETKKQSSKENAIFKQKRLERENKSRELNIEEAYLKGKIDALKINAYTNKEIKTQRDLEIYEAMKKAEEEGREDAVVGGYDIYFSKLDKAEEDRLQKLKEEESKTELMRTQIAQLKQAIPSEEERTNLLNDNDFKELYEDTITRGGDLGKVAIAYKRIREKAMQDAKLSIEAKRQAQSTPSQNGSRPLKTSIADMSEKEVDELFNKTFR